MSEKGVTTLKKEKARLNSVILNCNEKFYNNINMNFWVFNTEKYRYKCIYRYTYRYTHIFIPITHTLSLSSSEWT